MLPEEEANVQRECAQLRRDLEFCQSEIERLRAKLVISNDNENDITASNTSEPPENTGLMTSLAQDLQKGGIIMSKQLRDVSADPLKPDLSSITLNNQSRNAATL